MRNTWGTPKSGWPTFGADGRIVREVSDLDGWEVCRAPSSLGGVCVKRCGEHCTWAGE